MAKLHCPLIGIVLLISLHDSPICFSDEPQNWARRMFEITEHDFGTIARGAKAEYAFTFTNKFAQDVRIASVRSSCGCTSPSFDPNPIKTYEHGSVLARINSDSFLGKQGATLTVVFDKPQRAVVQLHVKVFVRKDVVFNPPSVNFGSLSLGEAAERTITIIHYGQAEWHVSEIKSSCDFLAAKVLETRHFSDRTECKVEVKSSPTTPLGRLGSCLVVTTEDSANKQIALPVEGQVVANVAAYPSTLFLGVVPPGESTSKNIVLRGKKPFKITSTEVSCECLEVTPIEESQPKPIHLLSVRFKAKPQPGKIEESIRIKTNLDDTTVLVRALAAVID